MTVASTFTACKEDKLAVNPSIVKPSIAFVGLTNSTTTIPSQLIRYNASNVNLASSAAITITGLQTGESIVAIDYRPATGQLYGLGSTSRIYQIPVPVSLTATTTAARAIGTGPFTPLLTGTVAGFDFNPTVDRIRIVTSTGQNLRINPETGTVATVDGVINGATPTAVVTGSAYTNNVSGATTTTLYDLDLVNRKLYRQDPPNDGKLTDVGLTNIPAAVATVNAGFDISPAGIALATAGTSLYQINLETGAASELGSMYIPSSVTANNTLNGTSIVDLAIPTSNIAYAVDETNALYYFSTSSPSTAVTKPITGLQSGENILGIDMRPSNGQLYALGSSSRLYAINLGTGAATAVNAVPFTPALSGDSFGFDFNPTTSGNPATELIRVVSNTGQNIRVNASTGAVANVDPAPTLTGGTPALTASAYTNNFASATATTTVLYSIDATTDRVYTQNAMTGVLTLLGPLGIDITAANGFDIGGTTGTAIGIFTVGTSTRLYTISLVSGGATANLEFPKPVRGFALGLGF
ncbi:MAG: DUF4394 domain-containing protein [Sphingobacteriaceae bacterium]|nr:MAG: DUF4394 domain-containing protein [Sphingobacteriaceae bacterium]